MLDAVVLDMYEVACLAGGTDRVIDAAVVALVDSGRVRVDDDARLTVVGLTRRSGVEAAVLDAIGTRSRRTAGLMRPRVVQDPRVTALVERLERAGLLGDGRRGVLRRRSGPVPTAAGRQALRVVRSAPPAWAGTSAGLVALGGTAALPDGQLRAAVLGPQPRPRPRRRGVAYSGSAASAVPYYSGPERWSYGASGAGFVGGGFDGGGGSCDGGGGSC